MLPQARTPRVRCRAFSAQVDGAISDARLQRLRWMRAIRLLIGQDVDPVSVRTQACTQGSLLNPAPIRIQACHHIYHKPVTVPARQVPRP